MMKTVHFRKTRDYLGQVKEASQKVEMLKSRIALYEESSMKPSALVAELETATQTLLRKRVEIADMIARIPMVKYQWVLTKRYVDLMGWDDIAVDGNTNRRQVVSTHGLALPEMQDVLVEAGIVVPEDAEDITVLLPDEGTLDIGTMADYLKYREEKKRGEV